MDRTWLINLRKNAGLTQQQVADSASISRNYYCEIEKGEKNPSGPVANRIANVLKFDMALFYTQKGRETRTNTA
jgi:putative transcriptional regulator